MDYIIDNCSYNEWRDRLSMDVIIKFGCCVCTGIFFGVNVICNFKLYQNVGGTHKFNKILWYFSISIFVEFLFYILLMVLQSKLFNYSISKPFVAYVRSVSNKHRFFYLLLFGSVVVYTVYILCNPINRNKI